VESKLADKKEIRAIEQKRQQAYSEDDYRNLESLMYDKFLLRLEAAQVILPYLVSSLLANYVFSLS
jgi:vacuolar protein sorting-associated protein 13A/C